MRYSEVLTFLVVLMPSSLLAVPASAEGAKKLIEFGWDEPGTAFLREHIAEMEKMPLDGVILNVHYKDAQGKDAVLEWTCWGPTAISWESLQPALADLKATRFRRFTDNFLRFNVTPGNVDWFDDFAPVVNNARLAARLVRQGRLKGILFDVEMYNDPLFTYEKQKNRAGHTLEEYAAQVRRRGEEIMQAFQAEAPGLTVFLTFGYSLVGNDPKQALHQTYGLLAPFLDGLFAAARGGTVLVDGFENSYPYRTAEQFEAGYRQMREKSLAVCGAPEAYKKRLSAGFGLWMDLDWRRSGWNVEDVSKNPFTPQQFEEALSAALKRSDRYVWIYTEQPRWWPRDKMPDAYVEAVRRARASAGMSNP
jgi:hypothetical protein